MFAMKEMRERAGLTQQEVADALEIKKSRYGDWERETREVNFRDAVHIAELFSCTLDELAGRDFPLPSFADPAQARLNDLYGASDADARKDMLRAAENAHAASEGRAEEAGQQDVSPPAALSA